MGKRREGSETLFIQEGSVGLLIGKAGATIMPASTERRREKTREGAKSGVGLNETR